MSAAQYFNSITVVFTVIFLLSPISYATSKVTDKSNQAIGRWPSQENLAEPVAYFHTRELALALAAEGEWLKVQPILEKLTAQYKDDGDTWYLLGLSYLENQLWEKAIVALTNVLELGTILHGFTVGSAPSNDLMMSISQAYSQLNDEGGLCGQEE